MIRKRWVQVRQFLICPLFFKPIWGDSLIMVPKNKLINLIYCFVDNKCTLRRKKTMIDYTELAIADCLTHPKYGIISHQPYMYEEIKDEIHVRDIHGNPFTVFASECEWATADETREYWKTVNGKFYGEE